MSRASYKRNIKFAASSLRESSWLSRRGAWQQAGRHSTGALRDSQARGWGGRERERDREKERESVKGGPGPGF